MNTFASGAQTVGRISFEQLAQQLKCIFERLARQGKGVLVEHCGTKLDPGRESA